MKRPKLRGWKNLFTQRLKRHRRRTSQVIEQLEDRTLLSIAVGPVSPDHGFPEWYEDSNAVRLDLCLDQNGLCLLEAPNADVPVSFPDNFGEEAFYFAAEAQLETGGGGQALLVLAREAAFDPEIIADGNQIVFSRVRIRISIPDAGAGATYTVTHPYGVDVFENVSAGVRGINFSEDIGGLAGDFETAIGPDSRVDPFLVWDTTADRPPGFIGDPAIDHQVTGSPLGTNFFKIEGPGIGGTLDNPSPFLCAPGNFDCIMTDVFSVMGKISEDVAPPLPPAPLPPPPAPPALPGVPGITVSPISGLVTTEDGGTATFSVVLNTQPSANVVIFLSSSNTAEGTLSTDHVGFRPTDWNIPQIVTVTGVDDAVLDGDVAYTIVTEPARSRDAAWRGLDAADVSVTNADNEVAGGGILVFTTADFNASLIDVSTVTFAGVAPDASGLLDVDGDGTLDLVLHFPAEGTPLADIYQQLGLSDLAYGTLDSYVQQTDIPFQGTTVDGQNFTAVDTLHVLLQGDALRQLLDALP